MNKVKTVVYLVHFILIDMSMWPRNCVLHVIIFSLTHGTIGCPNLKGFSDASVTPRLPYCCWRLRELRTLEIFEM